MPNIARRTLGLPSALTEFIDAQLSADAHASAREVVRARLHTLQEHDAAVERCIGREVAPVYDALKADPARAVPARQAFARLKRRTKARRARNATA